MRKWTRNTILGCLVLVLFGTGCAGDSDDRPDMIETISETTFEGFHGWNALTLQNGYVTLDVVPELGGKIMGYAPFGVQLLWHHPIHTGLTDIFMQNDKGEPFINAGGAKVWPAPQSKWGGPPDKILDGLPYEADVDGLTISVTSPEDTGDGRTGLRYQHNYSIQPQSTFMDVSLHMTNQAQVSDEWALWHLATVPGNREATVYVPVASDSNWEVTMGDTESTQWLGIEDGLFRARFNNTEGKVGLNVTDGWAAWHDEENDIAFVLLFPHESGALYPHNGHQFEIYSSGAVSGENGTENPDLAYLELEVLGPLENLAPGATASLDIRWAACRCSGIREVTPVGIISEDLAFDGSTITGKMSTFVTGTLIEYFYDADGNQVSRSRLMYVTPATEIELRRSPFIAQDAVGLRYEVVDESDNIIGVLKDFKFR